MSAGSHAIRPMDVHSFNSERISGAVADTTVKGRPGTLGSIIIEVAGAGSSTITVYDGAVSGGTLIAQVAGDGASVLPHPCFYNIYCATSIHVVTVDGGGTMRVVITHL